MQKQIKVGIGCVGGGVDLLILVADTREMILLHNLFLFFFWQTHRIDEFGFIF